MLNHRLSITELDEHVNNNDVDLEEGTVEDRNKENAKTIT